MSKSKKKSQPTAPLSTEDHARIEGEITIRAYELWQQSGCVHGNDKTHWLQAEREILGRHETV
jgi:hypothetical protein